MGTHVTSHWLGLFFPLRRFFCGEGGESERVSERKMENLARLYGLFFCVFLYHFSAYMIAPVITDVTMAAICPGRDRCSLAILLRGVQQTVGISALRNNFLVLRVVWPDLRPPLNPLFVRTVHKMAFSSVETRSDCSRLRLCDRTDFAPSRFSRFNVKEINSAIRACPN